jgi:indolepyruvate ferredoxin oxidoreductase
MPIGSISLDDKYALEAGAAYMSGIQALVRLPIEQMRRDRRAGLNTGCLISGYEGSPLGGYDLALERAGRFLGPHGIRFVPGVNEELALTAVMGSQLFQTFPEPLYDGAVGIWYGKGPGLDRSGDALRHANFAGIGENCGALALAGDDHISKSSSIPHQSELTLYNYAVPVLNPSNTQEMLDFGLYGIAMSRFGGSWVGLKLSTDICDGGAIVEFGTERCPVELPELLMGGEPYRKALGTMLVVPYSLSLEAEVHEHRLQAARAFARVNPLNRITVRHDADRLGIVTTGKSYADLMSALRLLGVGDADLRRSGVRILKLGMSYPLEPEIVDEFVRGLETVLVIEEKRSFVELQLREALYNRAERPAVYGKKDAAGETLLPSPGELDSGVIALALCRFLGPEASLPAGAPDPSPQALNPAGFRSARGARTPSYCSGCPHNRSTLLLEGQLAGGGIGCHGMAGLMRDVGRGIEFLFHMGSEGASWIGIAPFSGTKHLFQNLGDGTYFHSGRQAVQAAVAAGVDITFKILYNDAVAMTGGQRAVGALSVPALSRELAAQGIGRIVVLSDDPRKFKGASRLAPSAELRPREDLEAVLAELERVKGVSVMIYDQLCAAEKRRRRNRGILPQPERRIMINERVCEGCGDCVRQANCVSLLPVDTEYGPKTRVHQSSCNADYTCTWGDCPSFVSVQIERGSGLRRKPLPDLPELAQPEPAAKARAGDGYHILMPGVGGTGVVTINALLATAARMDGLQAITLDQTGVAQKGGAVVAHITLSDLRIEASQRIPPGCADLLLGFDLVGAAYPKNLQCCDPHRTVALVNSKEILTGEAIRKGLTVLSPDGGYLEAVRGGTRRSRCEFVNASALAETLFGGHIFSNMFLVGVAYQRGLLPLSAAAIQQAVRLNGVAVKRNLEVFSWGRQYACDPALLRPFLPTARTASVPESLEVLVEDRERELAAYQNDAYAAKYRRCVDRVREAESRVRPGSEQLARAVAWNLHKLMAYKDEYEVARLLVDPAFEERVAETFEKPRRLVYHLHPPLLRRIGFRNKIAFGPWIRPALRLLARGKVLRGTVLDPFGWLAARREERALVGWYGELVDKLLERLDGGTLDAAAEIAAAPREIRGYEEVKRCSAERAKAWVEERLSERPAREAA